MNSVHRLIKTFIPIHYTLELDLQRVQRTFSGTVQITGTVPAQAQSIAVHAKDLRITHATIGDQTATPKSGENDEVTLQVAQPLESGEHTVTMTFSGKITDAMHGVYPCYFEHNDEKMELLATQFESHHAREVFPCIDEPAAKATFDVTVQTEKDITVLGNMPIKQQHENDDRLVTTFDTTPHMSTYLLALVAGNLQKSSATTKRGTEVTIWATPAQPATSLDFALDVATRTIDFFNDYFDTPYPLPKSDHIALPDFTAGAMENWGLVTYRESTLLADDTTGISTKQHIATVIAHELSHQWFGNLVTMQWWDDLWLNESFATLMEYVAIDALFPDWEIWMTFATEEVLAALRRDSLPGVQPIKCDVNHPDEITTLFDHAIVYAKGARALRMLQAYVGEAAFQHGLKQYFQRHAYQNTVGDDLWRAVGDASGKDIASFMQTWLEQSGFPVIDVQRDGTSVTLQQKQFLIGGESSDKTWPIPLNANSADIPELLDTQQTTATTDAPNIKLNMSDTAHFITHYDASMRQKLTEAVANKQLANIDRLQLLHEATLLPRAGIGATVETLELLDAYAQEDSEPVWDIICFAIGDLKRFVEHDEAAENGLKRLSKRLAIHQYQRLGWDQKPDEPEEDTKLRTTVASLMVYAEDDDAIAAALHRYNTAKDDVTKLEGEMRPLILGAAVQFHDDKDQVVDDLLQLYKTTTSSDLQQDIAAALTSTRDAATAKKLLARMRDTDFIRPQDNFRWYACLIRNRYVRDLAWQWLKDNWAWIEETFGGDKSYDIYPRVSASAMNTRDMLKDYRTFFTPLREQIALQRIIDVGINEIEGRLAWLERDGEAVRNALKP